MALIKCPECGKEISDKASACPNCGNPMDKIFKNSKTNKNWVLRILIVCFILVLIILFFNMTGSNDKKHTSASSEKNLEVNIKPDDFSYSIDPDTINLETYNGDSDILEIKSSYEITGSVYNTNLSEFQISNHKVTTLILDEGITETKTSIFNGSDVEKIFFPQSMSMVYDYTLSYLHPKDENKVQIYYAGTEEEWNNIFTEYTSMGEKDSTAEAVGQAAADFINGLVGVEYDSTLFEYHFSASPEDLK